LQKGRGEKTPPLLCYNNRAISITRSENYMAEDIREGVEIVFADKKRVVYPVSLRRLRKLNKVLKNMSADATEVGDEDIDAMIDAAIISFGDEFDIESEVDREKVEEIVDIKTFNLLVSAAMGADPNV
jgi:hypothetical protein